MYFLKPVYASCPLCVITVGGGLIIAKKLGKVVISLLLLIIVTLIFKIIK